MGYYTNYSLSTVPEDRETDIRAALCDDGYDPFEESNKWYDHADDVKRVSLEFPDVIICLGGVGEEEGDTWMMYVVDGIVEKHKRPEWEPPPPSEEMQAKRVASASQVERDRLAEEEAVERAEYDRLKKRFGD